MNTNPNRLQNHATENMAAMRATIGNEFRALTEQNAQAIRLALIEAEALAWETGFPELVFPTLAAEKVQGVTAWQERQQSIRQREPEWAFAA